MDKTIVSESKFMTEDEFIEKFKSVYVHNMTQEDENTWRTVWRYRNNIQDLIPAQSDEATDKNRYFIISYTAIPDKGMFCNGLIDIISDDACYPSRTSIKKSIVDSHNNIYNQVRDVVINNIIELNKADFESWQS